MTGDFGVTGDFAVTGEVVVVGEATDGGVSGLLGETVWVAFGSALGTALLASPVGVAVGPVVAAATTIGSPTRGAGADPLPTAIAATGASTVAAAAPPMMVQVVRFVIVMCTSPPGFDEIARKAG